jgi:hypothetical protein
MIHIWWSFPLVVLTDLNKELLISFIPCGFVGLHHTDVIGSELPVGQGEFFNVLGLLTLSTNDIIN